MTHDSPSDLRFESGPDAEERELLADELHTGLAQSLTVLSMQAALLPLLKTESERQATGKALRRAAEQALVDARRLLTTLRSSSRVDAGADVLEGVAQELRRLLPVRWECDVDPEAFTAASPAVRATLRRVVEVFTGVAAAAGARRGSLTLTTGRDASLRLGLTADGLTETLHAASLRPVDLRARVFGGACEVREHAGRLELCVVLPLR